MWRTGVHHRSLGDTDVGVRVLPGGDCTKHPGEGCETTGSLCSSAAFDTLSLDRLVVGKFLDRHLEPIHTWHGEHHKYCRSMMGWLTCLLLAVAGTRHDPSWLDDVGLKYIQYQSESPHEPHYFRNLANEGSAYLQFIHDYYDCLPKAWSCPSCQRPAYYNFDGLVQCLPEDSSCTASCYNSCIS